MDISSRAQFAEDLGVQTTECQEEENCEQCVRIVVKVSVIKGRKTVMMEDLEANNTGDNFTRNVEI